MEILRKNKKEILEINDTIIERKTALGGLFSRLDKTEERVSELDNMTLDTYQNENQGRKKRAKKFRTEYLRTMR
jgi:TolA-binding protein